MGYLYHMKKCGKEESELEKMLLSCPHCGKNYRSRAGLEYHLKSEHAPVSPPVPPGPGRTEPQSLSELPSFDPQPGHSGEEGDGLKGEGEADLERTASGRVQRASAQVANFQLAEIANNDLPKDWPKKKFQSDLVPDDKKAREENRGGDRTGQLVVFHSFLIHGCSSSLQLKYTRPGLPAFSQEVLRKWKNEVKMHRKVKCPNQVGEMLFSEAEGQDGTGRLQDGVHSGFFWFGFCA